MHGHGLSEIGMSGTCYSRAVLTLKNLFFVPVSGLSITPTKSADWTLVLIALAHARLDTPCYFIYTSNQQLLNN